MTRYVLPLLLAAAMVLPAWADDAPKTEAKATPKMAELDKKAPAIVMSDTAGRSFELHDCTIKRKDAEGVVLAAAKKFGAAKDAKLDVKIADLKGVKDEDGEFDETLVTKLAIACGEYFGLTATDESAASMKTLKDLVDWIANANKAPILLITWSPRCPTSKKLNDKIVELVAAKNVRTYAVACNTRDTEESYAKFQDAFDFNVRIFPDREQKVTDILGGKTTPHFFLFDPKGTLRYKGGLDNDPMGYMEDDERKDHLKNAIDAVFAGKDVAIKETVPAG